MERRVDEPDDDGQAVHGRQDALEVALLEDLELGHGAIEGGHRVRLVGGQGLTSGDLALGPGRLVRDEDGAAHDLQSLTLSEHVLRAAEADALRAVAQGLCGLLWLVGVGPDLEPADLVRPREDLLELGLLLEASRDGRQRGQEDLARGAVDADPVALTEAQTGGRAATRPRRVVHDELGAAGDTRLADLPGHDRRVRRRPTTCGQDALRHGHAVEVIGRCLDPHEHDLLAPGDPLDRDIRVEHRPPDGRAG